MKTALKQCTSLFSVALLAPSIALANPTGGNVVDGSATITQGPGELTINQFSDRVVIDWASFDINPGDTTRFYMRDAAGIALNRILNSQQLTHINGNLIANGKVIIVNPNGVLIGPQGNVDVNSFIATSSNISNYNFMHGTGPLDFNIAGKHGALVENRGRISVKEAGLAALVAPTVRNHGIIQANVAKVQLAAADTFAVDFYGDGLISYAVENPTVGKRKLLAENHGTIQAAGGKVLMTAAAANDVIESVINNTGTIRAQSLVRRGGEIILTGKAARVNVAGSLDVSGPQGGGNIKIGGDFQGKGELVKADIVNILDSAILLANATEHGAGGEIVVWSEKGTEVGGSFFSRGGPLGGRGGLVETSSKGILNVRRKILVDTMAPYGHAGVWLLDPDILIIDTFGTSIFNLPFGGGGTSRLDVNTLNNAFSNVQLVANESLTFNTSVNMRNRGVGFSARVGTTGFFPPNGSIPAPSFDIFNQRRITHIVGGTGTISLNGHFIRTFGGHVSLASGGLVNISNATIFTRGGDILLTSGEVVVRNSNIHSGGGSVELAAFQTTEEIAPGIVEEITVGRVVVSDSNIQTHNASSSDTGGIFLTEDGAILPLGGGNSFVGANTMVQGGNGGGIRITGEQLSGVNVCFSAGVAGSCGVNDPIPPTILNITALDGRALFGTFFFPFTRAIVEGLVEGDFLTGSLDIPAFREFAGPLEVNAGSYPITQGTLMPTGFGNYIINFVGANFIVDPAVINIVANPNNKIYGDADPDLTFDAELPVDQFFGEKGPFLARLVHDINCLECGDLDFPRFPVPEFNLTGALSREPGENVGNYNITPGTLSAGSNFTFNFTTANFQINPALLAVAANPTSKSQNTPDPVLGFNTSPLRNGDTPAIFTGALAREPGEALGDYDISRGSLGAGANYTVLFTGNIFTITDQQVTPPQVNFPPLNDPNTSAADKAINQDTNFEPFNTNGANPNLSMGGGSGNPGGNQGGSPSDLAGLSPAAGGNNNGSPGGNNAGNHNVNCVNDFLNNTPCEI